MKRVDAEISMLEAKFIAKTSAIQDMRRKRQEKLNKKRKKQGNVVISHGDMAGMGMMGIMGGIMPNNYLPMQHHPQVCQQPPSHVPMYPVQHQALHQHQLQFAQHPMVRPQDLSMHMQAKGGINYVHTSLPFTVPKLGDTAMMVVAQNPRVEHQVADASGLRNPGAMKEVQSSLSVQDTMRNAAAPASCPQAKKQKISDPVRVPTPSQESASQLLMSFANNTP